MAIISVVFAPAFLAVNNGGGLISYYMPTSTAITASAFTNLAVGEAAVAFQQPTSLFAATIFLAGALVGMGGLFISERVHAPPKAVVLRESLKKPLLVAKAENVEGTLASGVRASTYVAVA